MQNFSNLNGNGTFTLRINSTVVQQISFTSDKRDVIQFDFDKIMNNSTLRKLFMAGQKLNISITLENFTMNKNQTKDFRVSYSFSHNYYD